MSHLETWCKSGSEELRLLTCVTLNVSVMGSFEQIHSGLGKAFWSTDILHTPSCLNLLFLNKKKQLFRHIQASVLLKNEDILYGFSFTDLVRYTYANNIRWHSIVYADNIYKSLTWTNKSIIGWVPLNLLKLKLNQYSLGYADFRNEVYPCKDIEKNLVDFY